MIREFLYRGKRDGQQDATRFRRNVCVKGDLLLLVADGHSTEGEMVAELAIEFCLMSFAAARHAPHCPDSVAELFLEVDQAATACVLAAGSKGGTTLTLVYLAKDQVLVANVGDSPALLILVETTVHLTEEHSIRNGAETERLLGLGYRIGGDKGRHFFSPNSGPSSSGNNLTRTIGDPHMREGYLAVPYVHYMAGRLPGDVLLVCTDGASNTLSRHKKHLFSNRDFEHAADAFVGEIERVAVDNASGIIVDLREYYGG